MINHYTAKGGVKEYIGMLMRVTVNGNKGSKLGSLRRS